MTPQLVTDLFTDATGAYRFARWARPVVPVVFGVQDATLAMIKGAIEGIVALAGHTIAETDPEMGANLMVFFLRDWKELAVVPDLEQLIPDAGALSRRLSQADAGQYRAFRFDQGGGIRACFTFVRMSGGQGDLPAADIALDLAARSMLTWGQGVCLLARDEEGVAAVRPEIGALIRAAYDPVLPMAATDASHALRLFARLTVPGEAPR